MLTLCAHESRTQNWTYPMLVCCCSMHYSYSSAPRKSTNGCLIFSYYTLFKEATCNLAWKLETDSQILDQESFGDVKSKQQLMACGHYSALACAM